MGKQAPSVGPLKLGTRFRNVTSRPETLTHSQMMLEEGQHTVRESHLTRKTQDNDTKSGLTIHLTESHSFPNPSNNLAADKQITHSISKKMRSDAKMTRRQASVMAQSRDGTLNNDLSDLKRDRSNDKPRKNKKFSLKAGPDKIRVDQNYTPLLVGKNKRARPSEDPQASGTAYLPIAKES